MIQKIPISYNIMKPGEEAGAVDLILNLFTEFIAPHYSKKGVAEFNKFVRTHALENRLKAGNLFLLAKTGKNIIGVIEIRDNSHVALLFVKKSHQLKGIAKELLLRSIEICRTQKPEIHRITVNSSPNAFTAYQKIGFKCIGNEKVINGIRFIPLKLTLD
ncbi:MAG: GNAT family N-acetyltransferase [Desulfobacula sp.]|nr:GNAT family N-acetyltransferase [Desulfobacula sp.]